MNTWKRHELKEKAKQVLKVNYWIAFLVALIFVIISGGLNFSNSGWRRNFHYEAPWGRNWMMIESRWNGDWEDRWEDTWEEDYDTFREFITEFPQDLRENILESDFGYALGWVLPAVFGLIAVGAAIAGLVGLALRVFVINPLKMGCRKFFRTSAEIPHKKMNDLGAAFSGGNYGYVVKTMFLRDLFTFLWTLLFIVRE